MACIKCRRKVAEIGLPHLAGRLCRDCFIEVIDKRIRKEMRQSGCLNIADKIIIWDDGTTNAAVCRQIIGGLTIHLKVEVVSKRKTASDDPSQNKFSNDINKIVRDGRTTRIVIPWDLEQESVYDLKSMISSRGFQRDYPRVIKPLKHVSRKELELYARIKGIRSGKKAMTVEDRLDKMLAELEKDSPDIRFALVRAWENIIRAI